MPLLDKKGRIEMDSLAQLLLLLAALVIIVTIIMFIFSSVDSEDMNAWACWGSNGLKASNSLFRHTLPSTCSLIEVEEPAGVEEIAKMLTNTWWMYGRGERDYGSSPNTKSAYRFTAKEEISFENLMTYLSQHKGGAEITERVESDYNYLQKGSNYQTVCFGEKVLSDSGGKIISGKSYYIIFIDTAKEGIIGMEDFDDKIAIATTPSLENEKSYACPLVYEPSKTIIITQEYNGIKANYRQYIG